jgi:metallo-beta-lactamase family protein
MTQLSISFEGAARTVTGSRHRITFDRHNWLLDCGLFQGHRDEAERINRTFRFDPSTLDAVVLSHAHLDHSGNLPTIVARGFGGPIHATAATTDLCAPMLGDSAFLMQRDVEHVNRHSRGRPHREPLYAPQDVDRTLAAFQSHKYRQPWTLFDGVQVEYFDAGHILGAAITTFEFRANGQTRRLCMGGDLGRAGRKILKDPETPPGADVLVLESTYGDRRHQDPQHCGEELARVVRRTLDRGGRVLVPAFAIGRAQELVATLHELMEKKLIPEIPVFVDSPLASKATAVFRKHPECFDEETFRQFTSGNGAPFGFSRLRYVGSAEESKALNSRREPCIIIAASGMCEGGRILHHLQHGLGNERNTVLFVGFQAEGTLGRRLRDGAENVSIFGDPIRRRAEIAAIDGFSAHADQQELVDWVASLKPTPRKVFLVHGELDPAAVLAERLVERLQIEVHIPALGDQWDLWN